MLSSSVHLATPLEIIELFNLCRRLAAHHLKPTIARFWIAIFDHQFDDLQAVVASPMSKSQGISRYICTPQIRPAIVNGWNLGRKWSALSVAKELDLFTLVSSSISSHISELLDCQDVLAVSKGYARSPALLTSVGQIIA